jgi:hypothetical protein
MKIQTFILTISILLISLNASTQVTDKTKFKMFCSALNNFSTAPNYVVITVRNAKTGETKELCTEATILNGAVYKQTGEFSLGCGKYKNRFFVFSNDSALWNISFDLYTKAELDKYAKTIDVAEIVQQIKNSKLDGKTFSGDRKEQVMFAHLMFNNGVMVTRGCLAGNYCGLSYFKLK